MANDTTTDKYNGVSSEAVQAKTGKGWAEWFAILDAANATTMSHPEIARYLQEQQGVADWWCQMVTVGYEQARGLRAKHEVADGYQVSASKTFDVPVSRLYDAWTDATARARWLPETGFVIRKATPGKSVRVTWVDGETSLEVNLLPKGDFRGQMTVQHSKLPDAEKAAEMKAYWKAALERLKATL